MRTPMSPLLAAVLLTVVSYSDLFLGTVVGLLGSVLLVGFAPVLRLAAPETSPGGADGCGIVDASPVTQSLYLVEAHAVCDGTHEAPRPPGSPRPRRSPAAGGMQRSGSRAESQLGFRRQPTPGDC